jgi:pentatricopeptide repeat domain-containing protein 1
MAKKFQSESELRNVIKAQKQNSSDTFGSLSVNVNRADHDLTDKGDIEEENFIKHPRDRSRQLRQEQYADMIKEHLKHKRFKEAINVLEVRMLKEDRFKPNNYIYNLLIAACAKVGYSQKVINA